MKTIFKRVLLPILLIAAIVSTVTVLAMAENDEDHLTDAMIEILADETLAAHKIGTYALANDGYLGIPVDFTFYHDDSFAVNNSYNGTALIMYVVNTRTVRAGTDSDVEIIRSMLERGYVVAVADYHNHKKAVANDIEWSTQHVNRSLIAGSFFSSAPYKSGFKETFIVPAGHNVELGRVFWEFDKHSTNGTLEEIVAIWNVDFRSYKGTKYVKWVGDNGRKATQDGFDGTSPVWYSYDSATGKYTVDNENGEYVQVKHTKALTITDCVKPDGTPIDLSLYMHIVYPTNPTSTVPTLTLASSSEHLASGSVSANRPHTYGFAFGLNWSGVIDDERVAKYNVAPLTEPENFKAE